MTTAERMRAWEGPAILLYGFRPFFFIGALWAGLAMALWIPMLSGALTLPTAFDAISWHAHEFLFGYLGAVVAGFLLTAVPNWTGRAPVTGWPLGALALLWLAGRGAVAVSESLPAGLVALIDLTFPLVLGAVILREIVAGRNWRNLVVLAMLGALTAGNALFHIDAAAGGYAAGGAGARLGLAAAVMMIVVIGGRVTPSFTRNWLAKRGPGAMPAATGRFDGAAILVTLAALLLWVAAPEAKAAGYALMLSGALLLVRLARWRGERTMAEPLVWILHAGYAFAPLGALAMGASILAPGAAAGAAAQHLWMTGAVGVMTLAVMTRATLGHSGRALHAGPGTTALYLAVIGAVLARLAAGLAPNAADALLPVAGALWCGAFFGFAALYSPALLTRRAP